MALEKGAGQMELGDNLKKILGRPYRSHRKAAATGLRSGPKGE